ncbi:MAG: hypothetical protein HYS05_04170 [Acidobacteria bacterium]|nr:hypothetical protein [Acidobacteriota bacterium]
MYKLGPTAAAQNLTAVAWFDTSTPLRSGWTWGQRYLDGGVAVIEARVGKGRVFLPGPEVIKRAQPHGTFKLVFNGIYYGAAVSAPTGAPTSSGGKR